MGKAELVRDVGLYVILDGGWMEGRRVEGVVSQILAAGTRAVQLRDKTLSDREFYHLALAVRQVTAEWRALLLVNDRVDVARGVGADGVHLGQEDLPARMARQILGEEAIIGISAETVKEALDAEGEGADYLGVGPMYPTQVKPHDQPVGLQRLREVRDAVRIPILGIGGITAETAGEVILAGADGVAVIRAVLGADDVAAAARKIIRSVEVVKSKIK